MTIKHVYPVCLIALALVAGSGCSTIPGPVAEPGSIIDGKVVRVHEGDSLTVLAGTNQAVRIRLAEIDAPELEQAYGKRAQQALTSKVFGKTVQIKVVNVDRYGHTVGGVYLGERWINLEMVAEGWAWEDPRRSSSVRVADAQTQARAKRLGLWADKNPVPPWKFMPLTRVDDPTREGQPVPLIRLEW